MKKRDAKLTQKFANINIDSPPEIKQPRESIFQKLKKAKERIRNWVGFRSSNSNTEELQLKDASFGDDIKFYESSESDTE